MGGKGGQICGAGTHKWGAGTPQVWGRAISGGPNSLQLLHGVLMDLWGGVGADLWGRPPSVGPGPISGGPGSPQVWGRAISGGSQ